MASSGTNGNAETAQLSRLKSERDRFVKLAFCWADILLELDANQTIVFAGGTTLPILGVAPDSLVGKSVENFIAEADRGLFRQLIAITEKQGRIDGATIHMAGLRGATPPLALAGYRMDEFDRHFFLAMRMGVLGEEIDPLAPARDEETGLVEGTGFANVAAKRLTELQTAGEDVQMTLVSMGAISELRGRLDEASQKAMMTTVGACFRAHAATGDGAGRIDETNYGLVHHSGLDVAAFERELQGVTREFDPEGKGAEVASATVSMGDVAVSEEDMAKSLLYVVNRFREAQGGEFTIKNLSTNLSSLMNEAAKSVDSFKRLIADGAFDLALQPIVDVRNGAVHHYEALARFHSEDKDASPFKQITFAEETGMIAEFDLAVVDKAIAWLGQWPRNTARYRVAVNISGHSVSSDRYVTTLHKHLRENGWVHDKLLFEITESSRMADLDSANTFIQGLRKAGHHVCLDDFGAGAASFQYLSALDVDVVKLDGSAIRNAQKGPKGRAFLTALTALCRSLTVETIAEMIDKEEGLFFVRDCGVDYVQGFLFGRPSRNVKDFDPLPKVELFGRRR